MIKNLAQKALPFLKRSRTYQPMMASTTDRRKAKDLLANEDAFATALFVAMNILVGDQFQAWEPESIWMELQDKKIDVPEVNRDKLLAVVSLLQKPAFYWDAKLFSSTAMAFNDSISTPGGIDEASPAQLSWAVVEAELLMSTLDVDTDFDYEPKRYTAASCHHDGLHLAPEFLVFCQNELDKLNNDNIQNAASKVQRSWNQLPTGDPKKLEGLELGEDPVSVQVAKLVAIHLYMHERASQYLDQVLSLRL